MVPLSKSLECVAATALAPLGLELVEEQDGSKNVSVIVPDGGDSIRSRERKEEVVAEKEVNLKEQGNGKDSPSTLTEKKIDGHGLVSGICETKGNVVFTNSFKQYVHSATVPLNIPVPSSIAVDFSEANRLSFPPTAQAQVVADVVVGANPKSLPIKRPEAKRASKTSRFKVSAAPDPLRSKLPKEGMSHLQEGIIQVLEKKAEEKEREKEKMTPNRRAEGAEKREESKAAAAAHPARSLPTLSRKTSFDEDEEMSFYQMPYGNHPSVKFPESPRTSPPKHLRRGSLIVEELDGSRANSPRPSLPGARGDEMPSMSKQLAVAEWAMRHAAERPHTTEPDRDSLVSVAHRYTRYLSKFDFFFCLWSFFVLHVFASFISLALRWASF